MKRTSSPCSQRGQALIEYAVVAAALVIALFVVEVDFAGRTGAQFLADSIRAFFRGLTHFISLP